jgi:hypothetical protein
MQRSGDHLGDERFITPAAEVAAASDDLDTEAVQLGACSLEWLAGRDRKLKSSVHPEFAAQRKSEASGPAGEDRDRARRTLLASRSSRSTIEPYPLDRLSCRCR